MSIKKILTKITERLNQKYPWSQEELIAMTYGLELLFDNTGKLLLLFLIGCLVGMGTETVVFWLVFGMFRVQAGGAHAKTNMDCTCSMIGLWGAAMAAQHLWTWKLPMVAAICLGILWTVWMVVPCSYHRVFFSQDEIIRKKKNSMGLVLGASVFAVICGEYRTVIMMALVLETLMLYVFLRGARYEKRGKGSTGFFH